MHNRFGFSSTTFASKKTKNKLTPLMPTSPQKSLGRVPEVESLKTEVLLLRKSLNDTQKEVVKVKSIYENETKSLKSAFDELQKELEILRFEKDEQITKQNYGLEDYSQLALELIKLRTEIDRLTYLNDREKRNDYMKGIEDQIQKESFLNEPF